MPDMEPSAVKEPDPQPADAPACTPAAGSKRLPCDLCGHPMEPEHAHYKCPSCQYILPCCGW